MPHAVLLVAAVAALVIPGAAAAQRPGGAALTVGPREGALTDADARTDQGGRYDQFVYDGRRGERLTVAMSGAFDSYLALGRMVDGRFVRLADNDDGGDGLDALLVAVLPADGWYVVRATTIGSAPRGAYQLRTASSRGGASTPAATASRVLAPGVGVAGRLEPGDSQGAHGALYDEYVLHGRAGERVTLALTSTDFDPIVGIGHGRGAQYQELASDDDGGEGTDARLEYQLTRTGPHTVRVRAFGARSGEYRLTLTGGAPR